MPLVSVPYPVDSFLNMDTSQGTTPPTWGRWTIWTHNSHSLLSLLLRMKGASRRRYMHYTKRKRMSDVSLSLSLSLGLLTPLWPTHPHGHAVKLTSRSRSCMEKQNRALYDLLWSCIPSPTSRNETTSCWSSSSVPFPITLPPPLTRPCRDESCSSRPLTCSPVRLLDND